MTKLMNHCKFVESCYVSSYSKIVYEYLDRKSDCLINEILEPYSLRSKVVTNTEDFGIQSLGWSTCEFCGWRDGKFVYFDGNAYNENPYGTINISWSTVGETYFTYHNYHYNAHVQRSDEPHTFRLKKHYYIQRPLFVIPLKKLDISYVIIDLLEQVYRMMLKNYGRLRKDSIIIIDAASINHRNDLRQLISMYAKENDVFGPLLRLLTDIPIFPISFLQEFSDINADIIFEHLHIGLDASETVYKYGIQNRPCLLDVNFDANLKKLAVSYQRFRDFVHGYDDETLINPIYSNDSRISTRAVSSYLSQFQQSLQKYHRELSHQRALDDSLGAIRALFVHQNGSRLIQNENSVIKVLESYNIICKQVDLTEVPFAEQAVIFAETDILFVPAGAPVYNFIFMRPYSVVIVVMQKGWCDWSWMYANQALLLDIQPVIYCPFLNNDIAFISNMSKETSQSWSQPHDDPSIHVIHEYQAIIYNDYELKNCCYRGSSSDREFCLSNITYYDDTMLLHKGINIFHWTRNFNLQGPRLTKSDFVTINVELVNKIMSVVIALIGHKWRGDPSSHQTGQRGFPLCPSLFESFIKMQKLLSLDLQQLRQQRKEDNESLKYGEDLYDIERSGQKGIAADPKLLFYPNVIPYCEVYFSSVKAKFNVQTKKWLLTIIGEIGSRHHLLNVADKSLSDLAICFVFLSTEQYSSPWCFAITKFDYYADVIVNADDPKQIIQAYAQHGVQGNKINGSDVFIMIDARLGDNAGFTIYRDSVGKSFRFYSEVESSYITANGTAVYFMKHIGLDISRVATRFSLQRIFADICLYERITSLSCGRLVSDFSTYAYGRLYHDRWASLPQLQLVPSFHNPFVFLHVDKTAGSTVREILFDSAQLLGLKCIIPGFDNINYVTFTLNDLDREKQSILSQVSVYAAHFSWGFWNDIQKVSNSQLSSTYKQMDMTKDDVHVYHDTRNPYIAADHTNDSCNASTSHNLNEDASATYSHQLSGAYIQPSCFIMGRHPVSRIISYYYQRVYPLTGTILNNLTVNGLEGILYTRQILKNKDNIYIVVDEGIQNVTCRYLANRKLTTGLTSTELMTNISVTYEKTSDDDLRITLDNMSKCVIGIQERWNETITILKYFFPWLQMLSSRKNTRRMKSLIEKETKDSLRPDIYQAFVNSNGCDMIAYHKMIELFDKQLQYINAIR